MFLCLGSVSRVLDVVAGLFDCWFVGLLWLICLVFCLGVYLRGGFAFV